MAAETRPEGRLYELRKRGIPDEIARDVAFGREPFCRTLVDECRERWIKLTGGDKTRARPIGCDPLDEWWLREIDRRKLAPLPVPDGTKRSRERIPYDEFKMRCLASTKEIGPIARKAVAGMRAEGPYIDYKGERLYTDSLYFFPMNEGRDFGSRIGNVSGDVFPEFLTTMAGKNGQKFHMIVFFDSGYVNLNGNGDIGSNEILQPVEDTHVYMQSLGGYTINDLIANIDERDEEFFDKQAGNGGNEDAIAAFMDTIRAGRRIRGFNYSLHGILAKLSIEGSMRGSIPVPTGEAIYARLDIRDGVANHVTVLEADDATIQRLRDEIIENGSYSGFDFDDMSSRPLYSKEMFTDFMIGGSRFDDFIFCRYGHVLNVNNFYFSSEYDVKAFSRVLSL